MTVFNTPKIHVRSSEEGDWSAMYLDGKTSVRTGFATVLRQWGPVYVLGFADAGMATAATVNTTAGKTTAATTVTGAFSGAGAVIWQIGKTHWTLEGCIRYLATPINGNSRVLEFGTGRTF